MQRMSGARQMHKIKDRKDFEAECGSGQDRPIQREDCRGLRKTKDPGTKTGGGTPIWNDQNANGKVQPTAERKNKSPDRIRLLHCRL